MLKTMYSSRSVKKKSVHTQGGLSAFLYKDKSIEYLKIDKQKKTEVSFRGLLDKNR